MNNKSIIFAAMAMCLSAGSSAFAQSHDRQNDRGPNEHAQHGGPGDSGGHGFQPDRRNDHVRANDDRRYDERGAGPRHDLYRGSDYVLVAIPTGIIAQIVLG
jgi:Ni/Co efflux regulator RcnB